MGGGGDTSGREIRYEAYTSGETLASEGGKSTVHQSLVTAGTDTGSLIIRGGVGAPLHQNQTVLLIANLCKSMPLTMNQTKPLKQPLCIKKISSNLTA